MIIGGILFAVGALGESLAPGTWILVISRFVLGFGVGVASVAGPLYAAEMAPSSVRGRYVSSYQLAITIGILLADISDAALSSGGHWRVMLGLSIVPGALLVLIAMAMPTPPAGTCGPGGGPTPKPPWPRRSAAPTWTTGWTPCRLSWPRLRA
jgi:MFS transporter, SP family, galactose:H+ symporter